MMFLSSITTAKILTYQQTKHGDIQCSTRRLISERNNERLM